MPPRSRKIQSKKLIRCMKSLPQEDSEQEAYSMYEIPFPKKIQSKKLIRCMKFLSLSPSKIYSFDQLEFKRILLLDRLQWVQLIPVQWLLLLALLRNMPGLERVERVEQRDLDMDPSEEGMPQTLTFGRNALRGASSTGYGSLPSTAGETTGFASGVCLLKIQEF